MHDLICNSLICKCIHMLVTKLKMQSSPYGDSVISAQTEHLKIKKAQKREKETSLTFTACCFSNTLGVLYDIVFMKLFWMWLFNEVSVFGESQDITARSQTLDLVKHLLPARHHVQGIMGCEQKHKHIQTQNKWVSVDW